MSQESIYGTCLWHAARCLPRDPALAPEDLVQAAYLKTLGRLDTTRSDGEQAAFLCRAITQVAIDHGRKLRRQYVPLSPALAAPGDLEHEALVAADLAATLARPRRGLAEAVMFGLGYTYTEIATTRGLPLGTVKVRIHWARQARGSDGPTA